MSEDTIIVCGGRNYSDANLVDSYLSRLTKPFRIVTGKCPTGADFLAAEWARANASKGVELREYPADWARHGRAAGPIRNQQMLDEEQPCAVVAFPGKRGTKDMKDRAKAAGVPIYEPVAQMTKAMRDLIETGVMPTVALRKAWAKHEDKP